MRICELVWGRGSRERLCARLCLGIFALDRCLSVCVCVCVCVCARARARV
jgi:hypothetical protein